MTTLKLSDSTKAKLDKIGNKGDTYEDIIIYLLKAWSMLSSEAKEEVLRSQKK